MAVLRRSIPAMLLVNCTIASAAPSIEEALSVGVYNEWTDNVAQTSADKKNDTVTNLYASINLKGVYRQIDYGIGYTVRNESYQKDTFGDVNYLNGKAFLNWEILPQRLFWRNSIITQDTLRSSNLPDVPDNRDQRTTLKTQPGVIFSLSKRDKLQFDTFASKVDFRRQGANDNDRVGVNITWDHGFSDVLQGGVFCSVENVEFKQQPGYDTYACQLSSLREINNGKVEFSIGKKYAELEVAPNVDETVYTLRAEWQQGTHSFYFISTKDLTDTSVGFTRINFIDTVLKPVDIDTNQVSIVARSRSVLGFTEIFTPTFALSSFLFRDVEDAYNSSDDTLREGIVVTLNKNLNWNYGAKVDFLIEDTTFEYGGENEYSDDLKEVRFSVYKDFSKQFKVTAGLYAENQSSDFSFNEFEANTVFLDLRYNF